MLSGSSYWCADGAGGTYDGDKHIDAILVSGIPNLQGYAYTMSSGWLGWSVRA